jgi:hypothetical protein
MKKTQTRILLVAFFALVFAGCEPELPIVEGNTFIQKYEDLIGAIDAKFEHNGWEHESGEDFTLKYELDVEFFHLAKNNIRDHVKGVWVVWAGERLFDENGRYHQMVNALMSTYLTTTGIPIENNQPMLPSRKVGHFYSSPFDFVQYYAFDDELNHNGLHLTGEWTKTIDASVPPGYYRLTFDIFLDTDFFGPKQWATAPFLGMNNPQIFTSTTFHPKYFTEFLKTLYPKRFLPIIRFGEIKKTPRIPWVLFPDIHVNGNVGVVADEDKDKFALSSRYRFPNDLIMPPGKQTIYPCFISNFPLSANLTDIGGATLAQNEIEHYIDYTNGEVSVKIIDPTGETHDLGTKKFIGKRRDGGGPELEGEDFSYDFDQWGEHTVIMTGHVKDLLGRTIEGGGSYQIKIGRWLTFSSTVKPGKNFKVGNVYPAKVEINPPCPADLSVDLKFYPMSDTGRLRNNVIRSKANNYGYFFPKEGTKSMLFDEPGEYRSDVRAHFVSPDGTHWYGHQVSVGVIVGDNSRVALHGMRTSDLGILIGSKEEFGMRDRYEIGDESSMGVNFLDVADCYDVMSPYNTGDTLHISATMSHFGNVDSYLSLEPKDPALREQLYKAFFPTPLLTLFTTPEAMNRVDRMLRLTMLVDVTYIMRNDEKADMYPILMQNKYGYQPFNFPESNDVETYAYYTSLRPGFSAYVLTSDSTAIGAYWSTSPNIYGHQINAGVNGDMPNDIYLTLGGLVYKDRLNGTVDYATYSSTIMVNPKETNNNRVMAPMSAPILKINGLDVWLGVAMGTQEMLEVGDRVSLGLILFPSVPAHIKEWLYWPDGERVETVEGQASSFGSFPGKVFTLDKPGVYKVKVEASYMGRKGKVFGSGDGVFNHYVVEKDHPEIMDIDLPFRSIYDVSEMLEIPISIREGYTNAKITYSMLFPGMIMDEGEFTPRNGKYTFRFLPSQFAMQFPNYDITDFRKGVPQVNDSTFFIFFVEATSPEGEQVYDVKKVMIRDNALYYLHPGMWRELSEVHPGGHPGGLTGNHPVGHPGSATSGHSVTLPPGHPQ